MTERPVKVGLEACRARAVQGVAKEAVTSFEAYRPIEHVLRFRERHVVLLREVLLDAEEIFVAHDGREIIVTDAERFVDVKDFRLDVDGLAVRELVVFHPCFRLHDGLALVARAADRAAVAVLVYDAQEIFMEEMRDVAFELVELGGPFRRCHVVERFPVRVRDGMSAFGLCFLHVHDLDAGVVLETLHHVSADFLVRLRIVLVFLVGNEILPIALVLDGKVGDELVCLKEREAVFVHRLGLRRRLAAGVVHEMVSAVQLAANLDVSVGNVLLHTVVNELLPRPLLPFCVATEQEVEEVLAVVLAGGERERLVELALEAVAEAHDLVHRAVGHHVEHAEGLHLFRDARRRRGDVLLEVDVP